MKISFPIRPWDGKPYTWGFEGSYSYADWLKLVMKEMGILPETNRNSSTNSVDTSASTRVRTFKNSDIGTEADEGTPSVTWFVHQHMGGFSSAEWDMEVTFTRKVRPFTKGDRVEHMGMQAQLGTVLAVDDDYYRGQGPKVWVKMDKGDLNTEGYHSVAWYLLNHV